MEKAKSIGGRKRIGIIAAFQFEIDVLKDAVENKSSKIIAGTELTIGTIADYDVAFMQCGMGKVSAAATAQAMITEFNPDYVINTGCAGALSGKLNVGDIVLSTSTIEWDLDTIAIGNPRGYVSSMDQVKMDADASLTEKMAAIIGKDDSVSCGLIVSGDQFVSTDAQRKLILDSFPDALCAEMEGAAVGHVCVQNGVPFCIIRCMSNNANGDSATDFNKFTIKTGEKTASYVLNFLRNISL